MQVLPHRDSGVSAGQAGTLGDEVNDAGTIAYRSVMRNERDYFYHRAEAEVTRAQAATHPRAAAAHSELAERYLERVYYDVSVQDRAPQR